MCGEVWKVRKSAETIFPFSCCPLVFLSIWRAPIYILEAEIVLGVLYKNPRRKIRRENLGIFAKGGGGTYRAILGGGGKVP